MESKQKHLVIIGGGFAGVKLAQKLERGVPKDWDIFLLSKTNFITYNPLLPEVVGASVLPGHVQAPVRLMLKRTRIRMVKVEKIDHEQKLIHYQNNEPGQLRFDQLVLAGGVAANTCMLEGQEQFSLPLKTVGDALMIRNQVVERLEQATIHPDPERRKELTTFAILGGGFSGVETAGELEDFLCAAHRYYKNVSKKDCHVVCIHSGDRLLPELSERLSARVLKNFNKRGIEVVLNERAQHIEDECIVLKSGRRIKAATIVCTIGTTPHPFVSDPCLPLDRGKVVTQARYVGVERWGRMARCVGTGRLCAGAKREIWRVFAPHGPIRRSTSTSVSKEHCGKIKQQTDPGFLIQATRHVSFNWAQQSGG